MRHTRALVGIALVGSGAFAWGTSGHAQERRERSMQNRVAAPVNAFELQLGTGYTQGFGMAAPRVGIPSLAGAGIAADVDLGYRATPLWSIGVQGEYQEFVNEHNAAARGAAGNVGVTFHAAPERQGDPWLRIATGYRGLWSVHPPGMPTTLLNGFEIAKAQIGYDVRVSPGFAIAPTAGIDVDLFAWQEQAGVNSRLTSSQIGSFVFAGLNGRFDVGGSTSHETAVATDERR
jgi:hypothetical protein